MDEVEKTGQEIVITKNGRPVSKLAPVQERRNRRRHHFAIDEEWEAER